jgi:hypothetical protein
MLAERMMPRVRFRVWTIMIAIAALAVLIWSLREMALRYGVCRAYVTIKAATVNFGIERFEMVPRHRGPGAIIDGDIFFDIFAKIQEAPGPPVEYVIFDYRVQDEPGDRLDYVISDDYILQIPLKNVAVLALGVIAILALAYRYRTGWRRLCHTLGKPPVADRSTVSPNPAQSGEAERV